LKEFIHPQSPLLAVLQNTNLDFEASKGQSEKKKKTWLTCQHKQTIQYNCIW